MPSATRVLHEKFAFGAGAVELIVRQVPKPVPPSEHAFKYLMVHLVGGARIVGYDNYKNVHGDVAALAEWMAIERDDRGLVSVPWDEIDLRLPLQHKAA